MHKEAGTRDFSSNVPSGMNYFQLDKAVLGLSYSKDILADHLSRLDHVLPARLLLLPQTFIAFCKEYGCPLVDFLATRVNRKLPLYMSPIPDLVGVEGGCFSTQLERPKLLYLPSICSSKTGPVKSNNLLESLVLSKVIIFWNLYVIFVHPLWLQKK